MSIELFKRLDEEKTRQNVDSLLKQYHRLLRIAGAAYEPKITATWKLEMASQTNLITNPVDDYLIRQEEALEALRDINSAYNFLNPEERRLIYDKYLGRRKLTDYNIYLAYHWSEATFYRELKKDLIKFAEIYQHGRLLVFENDGKMSES